MDVYIYVFMYDVCVPFLSLRACMHVYMYACMCICVCALPPAVLFAFQIS